MALSPLFLFGGARPWSPLDWTASDDRVRGGKSQSYLDCEPFEPVAVFRGNLDIKTLGGAGFASQRTTGEERSWDLSKYDGLLLDIVIGDGKQYTVILKDELLPRGKDGREQSTVSWEYDFKSGMSGEGNGGSSKLFVPWEEMKPTYRGREKKDVKPLHLKDVKRISLMMRSFFGTQEGDFSLSITSISASMNPKHHSSDSSLEMPYRDDPNIDSTPAVESEKHPSSAPPSKQCWWEWLSGSCVVS